MSGAVVDALERSRREEKAQSIYYRRLGAAAESAGDEALAARFHDLHADEQHQLSRLTARLVEMGISPAPLDDVTAPEPELAGWEARAREREEAEVLRYEAFLQLPLDAATRGLAEQIVEVERIHAGELGGKWTMA